MDDMSEGRKTCLICSCENTMPLDANALSAALGSEVGTIHSHLCRSQLSAFEAALEGDGPVLVACTQEAPLFIEVAEEHDSEGKVSFANIRENAGWSSEADNAAPKIAALLEAAQFETRPARLKSIESDGLCLVYGSGQPALEAAQMLSSRLSVTLLLSDDEDIHLPRTWDVPVYRGDITSATGSFGGFELTVDNYAAVMPSSREAPSLVMVRNNAQTQCSLILDLSGNSPLFAGHTHRDGYQRVDAGDPAGVLRAVIELSDMVGEFEKPIYVDYNGETCAHSRSQKAGCSKCLDVCPAGAISDAGDTVFIDSGICGGCGSCHSVCPTGSISYQYPVRTDTIARTQAILRAYNNAGGTNAVLLVHGEPFGGDLIAAMARYGDGLPANVVPVSLHAPTMVGHVEMASWIASGAQQIVFVCDPAQENELGGLKAELDLANTILSGLGLAEESRCNIVCNADPDVIATQLAALPELKTLQPGTFEALGGKRDVARLAFARLYDLSPDKPDLITLPQNAPYGRVEIDQEACTLCMSCASACPASAIIDTPGEPTLRFTESACVQCGLCVSTCPENALSLVPQLNLAPNAMQPITLYQEEPFHCIVCDTPFATKSTISRITEQLAGKHSMFADGDQAQILKMCETCRVEAQANSSNDPFAASGRPRVRTTEDYIEAERGNLTAKDFLIED